MCEEKATNSTRKNGQKTEGISTQKDYINGAWICETKLSQSKRDMQIKTLRNYFSSIRLENIQKLDKSPYGRQNCKMHSMWCLTSLELSLE